MDFNRRDMHNILPGLFLGSQEAALNLPFLKENNVTHVLAVGAYLAMPFYKDIEYYHIDVHDLNNTNLISHFHKCAKFIDDGIQSGGVLVHCRMGISRSSTIIIAYLMERHKMTLRTAVQHTREKRAIIYPNEGFQKQLELFEKLQCLIDDVAQAKVQELMDGLWEV